MHLSKPNLVKCTLTLKMQCKVPILNPGLNPRLIHSRHRTRASNSETGRGGSKWELLTGSSLSYRGIDYSSMINLWLYIWCPILHHTPQEGLCLHMLIWQTGLDYWSSPNDVQSWVWTTSMLCLVNMVDLVHPTPHQTPLEGFFSHQLVPLVWPGLLILYWWSAKLCFNNVHALLRQIFCRLQCMSGSMECFCGGCSPHTVKNSPGLLVCFYVFFFWKTNRGSSFLKSIPSDCWCYSIWYIGSAKILLDSLQ